MFRTIYVYGHLLTVAFSILMALAFLLVARRVGDRRDLWTSLLFVATAASGIVEMAQAVAPSAFVTRLQMCLFGFIFLTVTVDLYAHFADDVLPAGRRRRYWAGLHAYGAYWVLLVALLFGGLLGNSLRTVELWGVTSMVNDAPLVPALTLLVMPIGNLILCAELLLRPGPRQRERNVVAAPLLVFTPIIVLYEFGLVVEVGPQGLPIGGYFAALLGIHGVMILIARLEQAHAPTGDPTRFAGYTLGRRLGVGGMAEVFLARRSGAADQLGVQKDVALKRLHDGLASDPRFVEMFVEEARLVARLRHPNIVALHDVGIEQGQVYLAMELVDGAPLSKLLAVPELAGRPLPAAIVAEVGVQVADALAHAHGLRDDDGGAVELVHRDVSPQNILVDRSGMVKLADFGIARTSERMSRTATGVLKGKISYIAPEQIRAEPYDHRVDLYALGVVLFELATGKLPFRAPSEAALIFQIIEGRPSFELLDDVDPPLAAVIRAALVADPAGRYASALELRQALTAVRDEVEARRELGRLAAVAAERIASAPPTSPDELATVVEVPSWGRGARRAESR